jgi:uncharacterized membrane protein
MRPANEPETQYWRTLAMWLKAIAGLTGLVLVIGFLVIPAWKLKEIALIVVIVIGIAMMCYEYYEQLHEKDNE